MTTNSGGWDRREFLHMMGGLVGGGAVLSGRVQADERQARANPRATAGDPVEPNWKERLTVTVGPEKADLVGTDHKVLQAAVDYVARLGGGTVHILPGTYRLRNAVYLQSRVRLLGSTVRTGSEPRPCAPPCPAARPDSCRKRQTCGVNITTHPKEEAIG